MINKAAFPVETSTYSSKAYALFEVLSNMCFNPKTKLCISKQSTELLFFQTDPALVLSLGISTDKIVAINLTADLHQRRYFEVGDAEELNQIQVHQTIVSSKITKERYRLVTYLFQEAHTDNKVCTFLQVHTQAKIGNSGYYSPRQITASEVQLATGQAVLEGLKQHKGDELKHLRQPSMSLHSHRFYWIPEAIALRKARK